MRILVTGGAGFQGSNLSRALLDRGDRVVILNTWSERSAGNVERFGLRKRGATVIWGSITDPETVDKAARDHDLVIHLAANVHVGESIDNPRAFIKTNVCGTYHVLEACRRRYIPLVHASTCEVYGGCGLCPRNEACGPLPRIDEACPLKPQSPYAASKVGGEALVFAYAQTYEMPVVIVRPGNVFGPGQRSGDRGAVIPRFIRQALAGEQITIYGDGTQGRDFVHVDDLVRAYLLLADRQAARDPMWRVVNIGTGKTTSVNQIADAVCRITGSRSPIVHAASRPGEVASFRLDASRLQRLGFGFDFSFEGGLRQTVEWFKHHDAPSPPHPLTPS